LNSPGPADPPLNAEQDFVQRQRQGQGLFRLCVR
jgi:hypothetical protein